MLTQRREKALQALLNCSSRTAAASAAGISPRTLRSYLADPVFAAELQRLQDEQIKDAAQRGRQGMIGAMDALRSIVDDENQNGQTRVQAARALLEFSLRLDERENVLKRLDALEKTIEGS